MTAAPTDKQRATQAATQLQTAIDALTLAAERVKNAGDSYPDAEAAPVYATVRTNIAATIAHVRALQLSARAWRDGR